MALGFAADRAQQSVGSLVTAQAMARRQAPALLRIDGTAVTYTQLDHDSRGVRARLRAAGIGRHDTVAVIAPNGVDAAVLFLGVAGAAACAPLNPGYTRSELEFYLDDLQARAVVLPPDAESPARDVARARGIAVLELSETNAGGPVHATAADDGDAAPDDVALLLHTSGTTGRPRIIALSHGNLRASAKSIATTLALGPDDCCLNVMPLFHIHGLVGALLASLEVGASIVCTPGFSPVDFFAWLERLSPTWYTAVPTMHHDVLQRAPAHRDAIGRGRLRFIRSASSALPPDVMAGLERAFEVPVIEAYGMTEAAHQIASNPLPPAPRKAGSVGRAVGCEVAILNERGESVPPGTSGEIAIRGPNVTAARADGGAPATWLRTGDLGFLDGDGYLFIAGRVKEIINRAGETIAPREVDEVLLRHPDVGQAVTCAVPDARLGEDVVAVVVRRPGASVTERDLREFASRHLTTAKIPRRIFFRTELPKGATGKVQRIGLAKALGLDAASPVPARAPGADERPGTAAEVVLAEIWRDILKLEDVGRHDNFFELGGDSLAAMEVIAAAEARLGVSLAVRDLAFGTLQQVASGCPERPPGADSRARTRGRGGLFGRLLWRKSA